MRIELSYVVDDEISRWFTADTGTLNDPQFNQPCATIQHVLRVFEAAKAASGKVALRLDSGQFLHIDAQNVRKIKIDGQIWPAK